jgi:hypothetical protein
VSRFFTNPKREHDTWSLPDAEAFYVRCKDDLGDNAGEDSTDEDVRGWYVWSCFPGCMPDSEPDGPYKTEQAAIDAWRETHGDEWEDES